MLPTEGMRSLVNLVQIGLLFAIVLFMDIIFVKSSLLFMGILALDLVVCGVLLFFVIKDVQKYFDY
ncbi:hypothetical protein [Metallosphaera javensis (ex Sakai et al. 2022)]|uniref:hypothetical protein n=1 Tax=Metallosphaera javensis (ex Sakai et al. 2022) TaxID=2775498 RepID=UPI00258BA604|nr:MAG: hypothetical protein MjAS7_1200 [Metallosphaera javensis (ex Sakai et al. 2022)]